MFPFKFQRFLMQNTIRQAVTFWLLSLAMRSQFVFLSFRERKFLCFSIVSREKVTSGKMLL